MKILMIGVAGFMDFRTAQLLFDHEGEVIGFDNVNPYYEVTLNEASLVALQPLLSWSSRANHRPRATKDL
jgi:UDP-glucuronate 4-epimerase